MPFPVAGWICPFPCGAREHSHVVPQARVQPCEPHPTLLPARRGADGLPGADKQPTKVLIGHRSTNQPADDPAFAVCVGMAFDQ